MTCFCFLLFSLQKIPSILLDSDRAKSTEILKCALGVANLSRVGVAHNKKRGDTKATCRRSSLDDDDELPPLDDEDDVSDVEGSAATGMENQTFVQKQP